MPAYKLTYFEGAGRAELTRLLFSYLRIPFEDHRIPQKDWSELKPKTVLGLLPQLEEDGKIIADSVAAARYVARENGLYGDTSMDQAQTDVVVAACEDFIPVMWSATINFVVRDGLFTVEHKDNVTELMKGAAGDFYNKLEKWLMERSGRSGLFVGEKLTWADIHAYNMVNQTINIGGSSETLKNYPKLQAHYERIRQMDSIVEFEKRKPKSIW